MDSEPPILWLPVFTAGPEDRACLLDALATIRQSDSGVLIRNIADADEVLFGGTSLEHLQETFDKITGEFGVPVWKGDPRVRYLESIRNSAEAEGKYIRQTAGRGNYGHVKLRLEPNAQGGGCEFLNEIRGSVVPERFIEPIEFGIREAAQGGILCGHEMVDFHATLFDGSYHEVDSNEMAFQIAASTAFREAARKASPVVIEPMMSVVFTVAEKRAGTILAAVSDRRGRVENVHAIQGMTTLVHATVPLAEMLTFPRSVSQGSQSPDAPSYASHVMLFAKYAPIPSRDPSDDEAGIAAVRPRGPRPGTDPAAADPDFDWT